MGKCDNCKLRQYMAITFDLHWMGEDDCPFDCHAEAPTVIEAKEGELVLNKKHAFAMELDDEEAQLQVIKDAKKYGLAVLRPRQEVDDGKEEKEENQPAK